MCLNFLAVTSISSKIAVRILKEVSVSLEFKNTLYFFLMQVRQIFSLKAIGRLRYPFRYFWNLYLVRRIPG